MEKTLNVLKVQRTCVHDGPGLRTTVFFRGCGLRCKWCQNPESLDASNESLKTVSEILELVSRDKDYYLASTGGVTLSGGEPFLQDADSLVELLKALKAKGIHTAAETSLNAPWKTIEKVLPYVDLFLVDLKACNDDLHKDLTNVSRDLIKDNFKKLTEAKAKITLRTVAVPKLNDTEANIASTAEFIKSHGFKSIEILRYHNAYEAKAKRLNIEIPLLEITQEDAARSVEAVIELFKKHGVDAYFNDVRSPEKAKFTYRVLHVQNDIREAKRGLCVETDVLKTRYYTRHKGWKKPVAIHRAERLDYVLKRKTVKVYPGELIVGNFTSKRSAGQVWAEQYGAVYVGFIHQINKQHPVNFQCTWREKLKFYFTIFPHWIRHGLITKAHDSIGDFLKQIGRTAEMKVGFINNLSTIAHYIVNYERFLQRGTSGLIAEIEEKQKENPENTEYKGMIIALKALEAFGDRYAEHLKKLAEKEKEPIRKQELEKMAEVCAYVPKNPPRTFREALQSMMFLLVALCIEQYENAVSLGRMDQYLYPYYKRDVEAGILTYEEAKELLCLFILKQDEVIIVNDGNGPLQIAKNFETLSPDQALTFGGVDKNGNDATNDLTYMLLDACELQPLTANMTARIHKDSPDEYIERIAQVYLTGAPMPELYSDDIQIAALLKNFPEYTIEDARNYSIVGCVEPLGKEDHFGNTDCANINIAQPFLQALKGQKFDLWNFVADDEPMEKIWLRVTRWMYRHKEKKLAKLVAKQDKKLHEKNEKRGYYNYNPPTSMDELLAKFQERLTDFAQTMLANQQKIERTLQKYFVVPLCSTLYANCIKTGLDAYEGGAEVNTAGIQGVAVTDVADSLYAINEVCFKRKQYSLQEVIEAIDADFKGEKNLEVRNALLAVPKFGEDGENECALWVNKVMEIYNNALAACPYDTRKGKYVAGFYSLNVSDRYGRATQALPSGRPKGVPFANATTPHYGMEEGDLLSALNSMAKVNFTDYAVNGTSATLTIDGALFSGNDGKKNLASIFKTFLTTGGMELQPNVISRETLLEAYHNPEKHKYLMVRIAGYCAYFQELSDELKKIIINRTCYSV